MHIFTVELSFVHLLNILPRLAYVFLFCDNTTHNVILLAAIDENMKFYILFI